MDYQTSARFLGLPLIHVTTGRVVNGTYHRGIAKAWVAVGDIAFGVLFAAGGLAVGGVSIGGLSLGVLSFAGLAIGLAAVGGLAIGVLAVGGAAVAWSAALGGLAVARDMAIGGAALATHANDPAATAYFSTHPFFRLASWGLRYSFVLAFLPVAVALTALLRARRRRA